MTVTPSIPEDFESMLFRKSKGKRIIIYINDKEVFVHFDGIDPQDAMRETSKAIWDAWEEHDKKEVKI